MMHELEPGAHPNDEALAGWVDARIGHDGDPSESAPSVTAHLVECDRCRARVAALEDVVAVLRAEPPAPHPAAMAESRMRIHEAVAASGPSLARRRSRVSWWIPLAAAAALAALLVLKPFGEERPVVVADRPAPERATEVTRPTLPVVAAAEEAADLAAEEIEIVPESESVEPSTGVDIPTPGASLDVALADEFATLSAEDQDAILEELAAVELEM
jgi:hypothetical protein